MTDLLTALRDALGDEHVLTEAADVAAYAVDWRGAYGGTPLAVVRPASTAEVAAVVGLAHDAGVAIVPQGGNTGMCGGAIPSGDGSQLVLSLGRMRAIRDVDAAGGTITVEAGRRARRRAGRGGGCRPALPALPGLRGQLHGRRQHRDQRRRDGRAALRDDARSLVLGLEVVLPDGRVWDGLRSLRKDNTGYDLTQLFIGAEGTLGIVTAAVLSLHPATPARATAWVALPSVSAAASLLPLLREHAAERLTTWELVSRPALDLVLGAGLQDPLAQRRRVVRADRARRPGRRDRRRRPRAGARCGRRGRPRARRRDRRIARSTLRTVGTARARLRGPGVARPDDQARRVGADHVALDPGGSARRPRSRTALPGIRPIIYGHVGDGNLHYNLSRPVDLAGDDFVDPQRRTLDDRARPHRRARRLDQRRARPRLREGGRRGGVQE